MIVTSTKRVVVSIILNQYSGKERILSESITDMVWIYTYCSGDNDNEDVTKHLDTIV